MDSGAISLKRNGYIGRLRRSSAETVWKLPQRRIAQIR